MTVVASAAAPAATSLQVAPHVHAGGAGHHAFSAEVDALMTGNGNARSTDEERKPTPDDAADAPARQTADLRAALASLSAVPASAAPATTAAGDSDAGASPSRTSLSPNAAPSLGSASLDASAPAQASLGPKLTAERSYLAPAAFANFADADLPAPSPNTAAQADSRSGGGSETSSAGPETGAGSKFDPLVGAVVGSGDAPIAASVRGDAVASGEPLRAPPAVANAGDAPRTSTAQRSSAAARAGMQPRAFESAAAVRPRPAREAGSATAGGTGPAARSAGAVSTSDASSGPGDRAQDYVAAGRQTPHANGAGAATNFAADAASVGAPPAQTAPAPSEPATQAAETTGQTSAPTAPAQAATRVREIDLDLSPSGIKDASMTVRLAGDKLGVVIRAASGETAATLEGARDAIAERLAAIGQPVSSLIIQQTGANDATGKADPSAGDGDGGAREGQGGDGGDPRGARRGASRF
ncbi:hypothetical protein [Roseiarcus sp.]|uniref:flagellar hook-length control protein FliK n=1 Tax=Roseiarcus sp. TaxID=1969460 RepID=UPI003F9CD14A